MATATKFRAVWYKKAEFPVIEVGEYGQNIHNVKLELKEEPNYFRVVLFGVPGTPIFELGEDLATYYDIDFFELSRDYEEYFSEKIPSVNVDIGDRDSGSASQRTDRDPTSIRKRRAIDRFLNIPNSQPDPLPWEDKVKIYGIPNAIIVTELAEPVLLQWIEKGKGQAFFIDCKEEAAVEWLKHRRKCMTCGSMFHKLDNPEKFDGICNRCGTDLIYRDQDRPETVRHQFNIWRQDFTDFKNQMSEINMTTLKMDEMNYKQLFNSMTHRLNQVSI
jgi:adenylate kinase family enzyme